MKKTAIILMTALMMGGMVKASNETDTIQSNSITQYVDQTTHPSLLIPASYWKSTKSQGLNYSEGMSLGYSYSPVYQFNIQTIIWASNIYFGTTGGFNFNKNNYTSERSTQPLFNPMGHTLRSIGFKLGPVMLGCNVGYTWDVPRAHWLYTFGFVPGVIASAIGKLAGSAPTFFDGVYFMWGPEVHLQLGKLMLSGGYRMAPKLDMNNIFVGIGINFDASELTTTEETIRL